MKNYNKVTVEDINYRYIKLLIALKVLADVCLLDGINFKNQSYINAIITITFVNYFIDSGDYFQIAIFLIITDSRFRDLITFYDRIKRLPCSDILYMRITL